MSEVSRAGRAAGPPSTGGKHSQAEGVCRGREPKCQLSISLQLHGGCPLPVAGAEHHGRSMPVTEDTTTLPSCADGGTAAYSARPPSTMPLTAARRRRTRTCWRRHDREPRPAGRGRLSSRRERAAGTRGRRRGLPTGRVARRRDARSRSCCAGLRSPPSRRLLARAAARRGRGRSRGRTSVDWPSRSKSVRLIATRAMLRPFSISVRYHVKPVSDSAITPRAEQPPTASTASATSGGLRQGSTIATGTSAAITKEVAPARCRRVRHAGQGDSSPAGSPPCWPRPPACRRTTASAHQRNPHIAACARTRTERRGLRSTMAHCGLQYSCWLY